MTTKREELVEAVESAVQSHFGSQVIGHQVPIADTTMRMIRAQFALAEHDQPGRGVDALRSWIDELMRRDDDASLLNGFRRLPNEDEDGTRHHIGAQFRDMVEQLFDSVGAKWDGPPAVHRPDGDEGDLL